MIAYIAQMLVYLIAVVAIAYCLFVIFYKSNVDDNNVYVSPHKENVKDNSDDYNKFNEEIERMKQKMEEQNKKFEEAVSKVQIAEINAKIREKKLDIIGKCAMINEKIVDYLCVEGEAIKKE